MKIRTLRDEWLMCVMIGTLVSMQSLIYAVNMFCNIFLNGFVYDTVICYTIFFVLLFFSIKAIYKKTKIDIVAFFLLMITAWVATSVFHSGNGNGKYMFTELKDILYNPLYILFIYSMTGYVFSRYISNYELFETVIIKFSIVVVVSSTITFFLTLVQHEVQQQYMTFSYNMLLHTVVLLLSYLRRRKTLYLVIGLLGTVMIFLAGCRGAIVSVMASILLYMFFRKDKLIKKLALITVITLVGCIIVINFEGILDSLTDVAEDLNISTRTIEMIQEGEFLEDSGRGKIQEKLREEYTLFGSGLYGDRVLSQRESYAHNIIIEVLIQFGIIPGMVILLMMLVLLLNGVFAKNSDIRFFVIVFMSAGLMKLFFSSSYLMQEPAFFVLLGLCANAISEKRRTG